MLAIWKRLNDLFVRKLWANDVNYPTRFRAFLIKLFRFLYVTIREFSEEQLTLRAMGLVFTTLLSFIPLLAVSFSVLKAFGVHNQIEPFLLNFLAPIGPRGEEIARKVIGFVENMKVGVLGSLGLALLVYTVISLIEKIEEAFNHIWKIKNPRSFAQKFSEYMSVILIGPVLIFSAIGITASIMSTTIVRGLIEIEPFGTAVYVAGKLIPYIFVWIAFTCIYIFVPNTKVSFRSAVVGGLFGGVLWETMGWFFASFVASSARYAAIYSGFAILIVFLIWLYMSWLILLVGAKVSFYHQYPKFLYMKKEALLLSNRLKERIAFLIMYLIGYNYYHNKPPWTLNTLVTRIELPLEPIQDVIILLEKKGLIVETRDDFPAYLPAMDIETITLKDLLASIRIAEETSAIIEEQFIEIPEVDDVLSRIDIAIGDALGEETLKGLVVRRKEASHF